jgi:hypothetical protein
MSRFNAREVNSTWELEVLESGRKRRFKSIDDRIIKLWESDLKNDEGDYPVYERYLLDWGIPVVVDGVVISMTPLWVDKTQFRKLLKMSKRAWVDGGVEDLIHIIAKFLDAGVKKIGDEIDDDFVDALAIFAAGKIKSEFLNKETIGTLLKLVF